MTPFQGLGGNTALRDARQLCRGLVAVSQGRAALLPTVRDYEAAMIAYGFDAVRRSRRVADVGVAPNRFGRDAFKLVLRIANAVPPLKQRMFGAAISQ
jgi:2-polyprenyl-6-methoxyphenol hydroxylase-like FAD-dependent oxidoreductase